MIQDQMFCRCPGGLHCSTFLLYCPLELVAPGIPAGHRRAPLQYLLNAVNKHTRPGVPAGHRRAPLQRGPVHPGYLGSGPSRVPADLRRLHCGTYPGVAPTYNGAGVPADPGGLHCGRIPTRVPGFARRVSRRSRAGSIAARSGLRQERLAPVFPPFNGGLHCGPADLASARSVLPPSDGGLYCGSRIAALAGRHPRAPAVQRRAPLRQPGAMAPRQSACSPPINGGLHCGHGYAVRCPKLGSAPAVRRRAPLRHAS